MASSIYRLDPPRRVRDPRYPMRVLGLGLSRTGTDSLRKALQILGHDNVYHAFLISSKQRSDCVFWTPLLRRKLLGQPLGSPDFDSVLGNVEAVTDVPTAIFWKELIEYYPNAKVVLNRRSNVDAWSKSMQNTVIAALSVPMWVMSWFDASIYHLWHTFTLCNLGYYGFNFDRNGKRRFKEHYAAIERHLTEMDRPFLDWSVEDGWEPLCRFLEVEVPDVPFPSGNKSGQEFQENMMNATKDIALNALRNLGICLVTIIAVGTGLWYQLSF